MTRFRVPLLLALFILFLPRVLFALEPVLLDDARGEYPLGLHVEILEDAEKRWTLADVISSELSASFVPSHRDVLNLGLTRSAYWLRFKLQDNSLAERDWLIEVQWPVLDLLEFYLPQPSAHAVVSKAGESLPFSEWEIQYRNPTFSVPLRPGDTQTYYMRFETDDTMLVPLVLWSLEAFQEKRAKENYGFGLYYGILLMMILYNLLLFISVRDRSHLHYVLAVGSYGLHHLCMGGLLNQHLWPASPWWALRSVHVLGAAGLLFVMVFTRSFLMTKLHTPRLDIFLRTMIAVFGALAFFPLVAGARFFVELIGAATAAGTVSAVWAAVLCWRKGYRPAVYYLVAWTWGLAAVAVYGFRGVGLLPSNWFTDHALSIAFLLTAISLSLGLAGRINLLKDNLEESVKEKEGLLAELQDLNVTLEDRIRERTAEVEAANRHKSEFLANMSHELRTPLNAIIGFSEVLTEKVFGELNEKQTEYLEDIHSSGHHLLSLINDVLDLSKIEAGRLELEESTFDLPMAIDNTLLLMKERGIRAGISLSKDVGPDIGELTADERKTKQILINLLSNAIKFTPEGGSVTVRVKSAKDAVVISVADTGAGIAPQHHELIFEEFRQLESDYARKGEGTGLGLALSRRLVELHGGRIWVESEVGRGSTFTFTIPLKPRVGGEGPDVAAAGLE